VGHGVRASPAAGQSPHSHVWDRKQGEIWMFKRMMTVMAAAVTLTTLTVLPTFAQDKMSGDKMGGNRMQCCKMAGDKMHCCKVSQDKMKGKKTGKTRPDKAGGQKMSGSKMHGDKM
jgi:hypothetical protein